MSFREYAHYKNKKRLSLATEPLPQYGNELFTHFRETGTDHEGAYDIPYRGTPDNLSTTPLPETRNQVYSIKEPISGLYMMLHRPNASIRDNVEHVVWPNGTISYFNPQSPLGSTQEIDIPKYKDNILIAHPEYVVNPKILRAGEQYRSRQRAYNVMDAIATAHGLITDHPYLKDEFKEHSRHSTFRPDIINGNYNLDDENDFTKDVLYRLAGRLNRGYENIRGLHLPLTEENILHHLNELPKRNPLEHYMNSILMEHLRPIEKQKEVKPYTFKGWV